jgi:hypothetical protein
MRDDAPKEFYASTETVVATLAELFRAQGNPVACEVLENATARIEESGYDNWDGGQYFYTLVLELPMKVFAHVESDVPKMEKLISGKFDKVLRPTGNQFLQDVAIRPVLEGPPKTLAPKVTPADVEHLWAPGMLRLFLSHVSKHKIAVSKLKVQLAEFGITSFVAHEDIEPSLEWQNEIELALGSMHALVALLTPDFHASKWTDQEVGIALGKGTLVIPVRLGLDPYGFIGKVQGLPGDLDFPASIASPIVDLLLKHKTTADKMREALFVGLEGADSFDAAKSVTKKIAGLRHMSPLQLDRMLATVKNNRQVTNAFGVAKQIQQIAQRFKPPMTEDASFLLCIS